MACELRLNKAVKKKKQRTHFLLGPGLGRYLGRARVFNPHQRGSQEPGHPQSPGGSGKAGKGPPSLNPATSQVQLETCGNRFVGRHRWKEC